MLSRIAEALFQVGRDIERAQNIVRIVEVEHKMRVASPSWNASAGWLPIFEAFDVVTVEEPTEFSLYSILVLGAKHPYSVRGRIAKARERARALREIISEEMWEHLNRFNAELAPLCFDDIRLIGRSEFNRRVELFCDAFHGLADDTMIHGQEWHFLRLGKFLERGAMLCRILDVKRKTLQFTPEQAGRPIDFHQWQGMLRSLSGYEPYRRVHDARIMPHLVLDFVLAHPGFPRSFLYSLSQIESSLDAITSDAWAGRDLLAEVAKTQREVASESGDTLLRGGLESYIRLLARRCDAIEEGIESAFFRSRLPAPRASASAPGELLHGQVQQ